MEKKTIKTLLVEDNPPDIVILTENLERDPLSLFELTTAEFLADTLTLLRQDHFDVILLDLGLPDSVGLETFTLVHQTAPHIPIIILSGHTDDALALTAVHAGAQDYLVKGPVGWSIAARSIRYAIERKQAEEKLRESEVLLRQVLESAPNTTFALDRNYCFLIGNQRHQQELVASGGHPLKVGEPMLSPAYPSEILDLWRTAYDRALAGEEFSLEVSWVDINGQLHIHENMFSPLRDATDMITGALVVAHDITERKQAEQKLRESEEKYRGLMETLDSVIATIDYEGKFLYMNEVAARQLGGTPQGLVGKTIHELFPGPVASQQLEGVRQVIHEDKGRISESLSFVHGESRWFHNSLQPIHDEHGQVVYALLNATDIHELKSTQQALAELNRTLEGRINQATAEIQDLYDNAPTGYHSLDANGLIIMINQTELNWLGYTHAELIGQPFARFFTPASLATFQANFPNFKQRGWVRDLEFDLIRKDGSTFPVLISATAIKDERGNYVMSRSTVFDNTERKKADEKLRESHDQLRIANIALEKALRVKDEFLANMSHELRTPLNGILGMTEILLDGYRGPLNERQRTFVSTIETSGRYLLSLINDVLDLSKIEADKMELHLEPVPLTEICQESLAFIKDPATKKGVGLQFIHAEKETIITADGRRLKQILVNLLHNAVKFTPANGRVTLEIRPSQEEQCVALSVTDTGIGISVEDQKHLFAPFTQVDNSLTRNYEGTGLGLALVKRLVDMHGGTVFVESALDQGSRFTVVLPWQESTSLAEPVADEPEEPARESWKAKSKATVLLVEDNATNIMALGDYLDIKGYSMVYAHDGLEALAKAAASAPDIILMDIQMPKMDGLEAIRRLRTDPQFATTPIIALTARAMVGDYEQYIAAGATGYMSKPVRLGELVAMIEKLLLHRPGA